MKTILLADDHVIFLEGLSRIIERWDDFQIVAKAPNGLEAVRLTQELLPDFVLMDISMPVMNGFEATQQIARLFPSIKIIMLTVSEEAEDLFKAIKCGASGYVLKNVSVHMLHEYLQGVERGETALSSIMATKILKEFNKPASESDALAKISPEPLTERERQILELVVEGRTNGEIAGKIYLSEHSVKKYLGNILDKLHLNNRVELAVYAVREGLVGKS